MLPPKRLPELLHQAVQSQIDDAAAYDNDPAAKPTLFEDFRGRRSSLPTHCAQELRDHREEVWTCSFSPDGAWVATACKGGQLRLWKARFLALNLTLRSDRVFAGV